MGAALLAVLALRAPPDGHERGAAAQFLGRFHPVIVHVPIALMLLVPVLELAGRARERAHLRAAAGFVLGLTVATAGFVALDGWLLGRTGGYRGHLVNAHLWGGVAFTFLCVLAASLRPSTTPASPRLAAAYALALVACLGVLVWTSHQGGTLTHGEGYLTKEMPPRLRAWLGLRPPPRPPAPAPALAQTVYALRIQPILNRSCVSCHGPNKVKGGLRLDTYAGLMDGGDDDVSVVPWLPSESDLVRRITLPPDDDDFMPSNGKKILTPAEVRLIEDWIAAGASDHEPIQALSGPAPVAK
jgi:mono/diheme cytochrome c family protein/uncharacterized membrane protein